MIPAFMTKANILSALRLCTYIKIDHAHELKLLKKKKKSTSAKAKVNRQYKSTN